MDYDIVWSPGRTYEIVGSGGLPASLVMEGGLFSPDTAATITVGSRVWSVSRRGLFWRQYTLTDDQGRVTSATNNALYHCDLTLPVGENLYRFETPGWLINTLTVSENNRVIVEVLNRWLRFGSNAGRATFMQAPPSESHLLLALMGFYQLRVLEYSSS